MRGRIAAALVVPLTVLACGGHSTPTSPTSAVLDLVPGSYALTLTMSQHGDAQCPDGTSVCMTISLCGGVGGPSASTVATVVRLDRSGDAVTIRPEGPSATFRLDLHVAGSVLTGTASGEFREGALRVAVAPGGTSVAVATGTVLTASVAGKLDGNLSIGGYGCSNNGHTWTLAPR
jgi:hypothetical protein